MSDGGDTLPLDDAPRSGPVARTRGRVLSPRGRTGIVIQGLALGAIFAAIAPDVTSIPGLAFLLVLAASAVLTVFGFWRGSWVMLWLAALGTLPLLVSSIGIYTVFVTGFQLAAAGALRRNASAGGWVTYVLVSFFVWVVVLFSGRFTGYVWVSGLPMLPLSFFAMLLPLLPIGPALAQPALDAAPPLL